MLQPWRWGTRHRGSDQDVAAHGMYRRRETRHDQLAGEIAADLRRYSVDAQHIGHAFANLHGLNATDLAALIAVMEAERVGDPITPGRLGEQLNLSSGSITALLDRHRAAGVHLRAEYADPRWTLGQGVVRGEAGDALGVVVAGTELWPDGTPQPDRP